MTWAEIDSRLQREMDTSRLVISEPSPPERRGPFSVEEVLDEVALVVGHTARLLGEHPTAGMAAFGRANMVASWRDQMRPISV